MSENSEIRDAEVYERDTALLESIRKDEPGAFEEFVDAYGDRIYGFGIRVCGEREDARDVFQDTLLQAFRSLKELKEPRALRSWLYRVVSNACLMKRRKKSGEPDRTLALEELMPDGQQEIDIRDSGDLPDRIAERHQVQQVVREAIDALPSAYRVVLLLRDMEQLSTRETAETLEVPESTVKMRLHRARLAVHRELLAAASAGRLAEESS